MSKKLYKANKDIKIDGVCAGFSNFFGIDVTIIRLLFVIFAIFGGTSIILYIICMLIMPREPEYIEYTEERKQY